MEENKVTISLKEYLKLYDGQKERDKEFQTLLAMVFENTELTGDKKNLKFDYYNSKNIYSAKETADIVSEKIALLVKIRFEHDLRKIYDPYETDQRLVERQEDLMYDMLYATETYMDLNRSNKINIKNY